MNDLTINRLDPTKTDIGPLVEESLLEGHRHMDRLVQEYREGVNRFDQAGEALYAVWFHGEVVAVCGLNNDPYTNERGLGVLEGFTCPQGTEEEGSHVCC